ncbi:SDR family NAD(P)-dependent oxidoreductase [Edaphosphingomonas haloaromaticamans]|uniref:Putative oxidoreductase n=1 Tax=Edaphosphingomonas haloaromaticamans TaxID=653954 RepID=A0A1S1H8V1_9SPHN|nr:SDR family oxidoreductase [Sphingomonas haloaromaticamans]OHT18538.1 putative oxidoreductase [Sphingomonas haloaromaticamans]
MTSINGTALVTGASSGIGATYAERLARRGHDLVLVARSADKLQALAARLRAETGRQVDVLSADLGKADDLARVEQRLRDDKAITILVNNAGIVGDGPLATADPDKLEAMIRLNVVSTTRLAAAIFPRLLAAGSGAIINIASVTALMSGAFEPGYGATKAYLLNFTEALQAEAGDSGVRIQAVLPGITRTAIWDSLDGKLDLVPAEMVMEVDEMVDAAIAGFDQGEAVTIPSLPDAGDWETYVAARAALAPNLSHAHAAPRYGLK